MSRFKPTLEHLERRRAYPLEDKANQAYCVMQWLSGLLQREIAVQFGYDGPVAVNLAICRFVRRMDEDYMTSDRKNAACRALAKFLAERGELAPSEVRPTDGRRLHDRYRRYWDRRRI